MRLSIAFFVLIFLVSFSAQAYYGSKGNYKWWKNPNIASEMGLTNEQADSIEKIFRSHKNSILMLQKELRKKEIELGKKINQTDSNNEEVLALIDEIEILKADLTRIKVQMFLQVKSVLTPEQIQMHAAMVASLGNPSTSSEMVAMARITQPRTTLLVMKA